jgi:5-(carboxyamino)imidazole ribonucleotide synthase
MNKRLGIIGCGQLGQMLGQSARHLGAEVSFLAIDEIPVVHGLGEVFEVAQLEQFLARVDYVTVEREAIPEAVLKSVSSRVSMSPSFDALLALRSRESQKAIFDTLGLTTAQWCYVNNVNEYAEAVAAFGCDNIRAKRVLGGYDGGGQWRINKQSPVAIAADNFPIIMEAEINIDYEISVLMARGHDGDIQCYPLNHNEMRDGVLTWSFVPAQISEAMAEQAKAYAKAVMDHLDYVGIMAMELFVSDGELIINEIAPRVHNTGHWTIEGCQCSQFEQHVRAVMQLPLQDPEPVTAAALCNLLGDCLPSSPPAELVRMYLHWYGKSLRPGRKMGHLTLIGPDSAAIRQAAKDIGLHN